MVRLFELIGKAYRNRTLLGNLAVLASTEQGEARERAAKQVAQWGRVRQGVATDLGSAKGFAADFLRANPEVTDQLRDLPHFGSLAPLFEVQVSRLDYLLLQFELLLRCKQRYPSIGLGSVNHPSELMLEHCGKALTGLELLQLWAVLLNMGRLFGTVATERGVLFELMQHPAEYERFLAGVPPELCARVADILKSESLHRFPHAIAAARLGRMEPANPTRATCVQALRLFLEPTSSSRMLRFKSLFSTVRRVAYLELHSRVGLETTSSTDHAEELLAKVLQQDGVLYEAFEPQANPATRLMDALDQYHFETVFSGEQAGVAVLNHLREFHQWWHGARQRGEGLAERLDALHRRPGDWPTGVDRVEDYIRLATLEIPLCEGRWVKEVEQWKGSGDAWSAASFYLSYPPADNVGICTIYSTSAIDTRLVRHIAGRLADLTEKNQAAEPGRPLDSQVRLWRSVARFGKLVFERGLIDDYHIAIRPVALQGRGGVSAIAASSSAAIRAALAQLRSVVADEVRAEEYRLLEAAMKRIQSDDAADAGPWIVFLGKVLVFQEEGKPEVGELDGLFGQCRADRITWHMFEAKSTKQAKPRRQLRDICALLRREMVVSPVASVSVPGGGVGYVTASWSDGPLPDRERRGGFEE